MKIAVMEIMQDPQHLEASREPGLLDTPAERAFDRLARRVARIVRAPIALVNLGGSDRQFCKGSRGLPATWSHWRGTPLSPSFRRPMRRWLSARERCGGRRTSHRCRWAWLTVLPVMLLCLAVPVTATESQTPEPLILAVHPYLPPAEIMQRFNPLAEYLARATGRPVQVRVGRDYNHHIETIGADSVDIAYMGPVSYVKLVARYGKKPLLARQEIGGQRYLLGVIIVRQDSPLRKLAELKGKRFAFGDPDSTMSHVIPQRMLETAGVPERALGHHAFLGSHKNVALAVLAGDYDAGAVKEEVFQDLAPKGLRALATTPPVADHVFVTRANLPAALTKTLRHAFWQLKDTAEGKAVMVALRTNMTALVPAQDKDYDGLRAILGVAASGPH